MIQRILTALIVASLWLLLLFAAPLPVFWTAICLIGVVAMWEFGSICLQPGEVKLKPLAVALWLLPLLASFTGQLLPVAAALVPAWLLLALLVVCRNHGLEQPFSVLCRLTFGLFLIGFFPAHIPLIMHMPEGALLLVFVSAVTASSDIAALFVGKHAGRRKLCPAVSPNKTVEGFFGGLFGGAVAGLLVSIIFFQEVSLTRMVFVSVLLAGVGVLGDLTESMLKRWANVKDSGALLPGHGGILDRIDSLLLSVPTFYYLLRLNLLPPLG